MKQSTLIRRLARASGLTTAAAADQLDSLIGQIVTKIRNGKAARIPGLGSFSADEKILFRFSRTKSAK